MRKLPISWVNRNINNRNRDINIYNINFLYPFRTNYPFTHFLILLKFYDCTFKIHPQRNLTAIIISDSHLGYFGCEDWISDTKIILGKNEGDKNEGRRMLAPTKILRFVITTANTVTRNKREFVSSPTKF